MKTFPATILILLILLFSCGCAIIPRPYPQKEISLPDAEKIISDIKAGNDMVRSFYTLGIVSIKGWVMDSDADILIAGIKEPFTMKIEITHSWGKPLLHILIKDSRLEVLSFQEKRIYMGAYTPETLARFLPGLNLDQVIIWSILSGRAPIATHDAVRLLKPDRIILVDNNEKDLETAYLPVDKQLPKKIMFPGQSINISFSDIKEEKEMSYAGKIELTGIKGGKDLSLKINTLSSNISLPDKIFTIENFSSYEIVNLDEHQEDTGR
jgi:hypothetical protein